MKQELNDMINEKNSTIQAELFQKILNNKNIIDNQIFRNILTEISNNNKINIDNNSIDTLMKKLQQDLLKERETNKQKERLEKLENELSLFEKIMLGIGASVTSNAASLINGVVNGHSEQYLNNVNNIKLLNIIKDVEKLNIKNENIIDNGLEIPGKGNGFMDKFKDKLKEEENKNNERDLEDEKRRIDYHGGKWNGYSVVEGKNGERKVYDDKGKDITETNEGQDILDKARIIWGGIDERNRENKKTKELSAITKMELEKNSIDNYIISENIEKNIEKKNEKKESPILPQQNMRR